MQTSPFDEAQLKALLKDVFTEVLDQRRDWFAALVSEAVEDIALTHAIKSGEDSEDVSREDVFKLLEA